ncbi:MAG: hypothetical protein HDR35_09080 [Treponema sp.]|nr:hypothetical protein [Treponema sp.]
MQNGMIVSQRWEGFMQIGMNASEWINSLAQKFENKSKPSDTLPKNAWKEECEKNTL